MTTDSSPFSGLLSPSAAYRADMEHRGASFGSHDAAWLRAANALHLAATVTGPSVDHLSDAVAVATDAYGREDIQAFVEREWRGERCDVEALVLLAESAHEAGALHLAAVILDDLLRAATNLTTVQRGRILALRARTDWKLGLLDEAHDRYDFIADLAREDPSGELATRAEIGLMILAQLRGNMPQVREHGERAAATATARGFDRLAVLAYQGIAMAHAKAGDFASASRAGWSVVELSRGDPIQEAEGLQILGQILLESGESALARAAFAAVMTRPAPPRVLLPALGALALASARSGRESTLEWAIREVWRAQRESSAMYQVAEALWESAVALHVLGRTAEAERYRDAAAAIADARGFHELRYRIGEGTAFATSRVAEPAAGAAVDMAMAGSIAALEPERLPVHLVFESAPA